MMMLNRATVLATLLAGAMLLQNSFAQSASYPTPNGNPDQLFYLQRTPNKNTIVCELNKVNGEVDVNNPIHVFWIRYDEKGQEEELSYIQRKFAYGIKSKKVAENNYELHFVSYKKRLMYLIKAGDNQFHVFTTINQKQAVLSKIYIEIKKGGTFWSPNIDYVELTGYDPITRVPVSERVKI